MKIRGSMKTGLVDPAMVLINDLKLSRCTGLE